MAHPGQATLDRLNAAGSGAVARDLTQDEDRIMRRALTASSTPPEPSCCALCGFLQNENAKLRAALLALVRQ